MRGQRVGREGREEGEGEKRERPGAGLHGVRGFDIIDHVALHQFTRTTIINSPVYTYNYNELITFPRRQQFTLTIHA